MIIRGCRYVVGSKTSRCRESANGVHKPSSVYKDQDLTDKIYLPLPQLIKIKASPRVVFFLMSQSNPVQSNPANWLHGSINSTRGCHSAAELFNARLRALHHSAVECRACYGTNCRSWEKTKQGPFRFLSTPSRPELLRIV